MNVGSPISGYFMMDDGGKSKLAAKVSQWLPPILYNLTYSDVQRLFNDDIIGASASVVAANFYSNKIPIDMIFHKNAVDELLVHHSPRVRCAAIMSGIYHGVLDEKDYVVHDECSVRAFIARNTTSADVLMVLMADSDIVVLGAVHGNSVFKESDVLGDVQ